jgi:hypothetical protein
VKLNLMDALMAATYRGDHRNQEAEHWHVI